MLDRIPTPGQEGRVLITPESGEPFYARVEMADNPTQEGSPLNKGNLLPDSIPKLLGLKMSNPQVKDALNVLANVGNLHVWERVQTYADPVPEVPAGYTLGEVEENVVLASRKTTISTTGAFYYYYGDSVTVKNDGTVNAPSSDSWAEIGRDVSATTIKSGPLFVKGSSSYISSGSGHQAVDVTNEATKVFYIPSGGTLSVTVDSNAKMCYVVATKYQPVIGYPYTPAIPAGTHVDYLTSTDPNAYPKQSAEGGQDAYYELGDVQSISVELSSSTGIMYSSSVSVSDDGIVNLVSPSTGSFSTSSGVVTSPDLKGKYVEIYGLVGVWFILEDSKGTHQIGMVSYDKAQPVTGHAAIPANTTITYLGQLGGAARIEVGTYVGTGTYGYSNKNSLSLNGDNALISIYPIKQISGKATPHLVLQYPARIAVTFHSNGGGYNNTVSWGERVVSWYGSTAFDQMNESGYEFLYFIIYM